MSADLTCYERGRLLGRFSHGLDYRLADLPTTPKDIATNGGRVNFVEGYRTELALQRDEEGVRDRLPPTKPENVK